MGREIESRTTAWEKIQFDTVNRAQELDLVEARLAEIRGHGVDPTLLRDFRSHLVAGPALPDGASSDEGRASSIDAISKRLSEKADDAINARSAVMANTLRIDELDVTLSEAKKNLEQAEAQAQIVADNQAPNGDEQKRATAFKTALEAINAAQSALWALEDRGDDDKPGPFTQLRDGLTKIEAAIAGYEQQLNDNRDRAGGLQESAVEFEKASAADRAKLFKELDGIVDQARVDEDAALQDKKFKSADFDESRAQLGLKVTADRSQAELDDAQEEVTDLNNQVAHLQGVYEARSQYRLDLQDLRDQMKSVETELDEKKKELDEDLERIEKSLVERRSNYFEMYGYIPIPGKKWLEAPILDAFNSPLKIDNLWHEGLEWDITFRTIRRFDRCTTCHRGIQKALPGSSTDPAYLPKRDLTITLSTEPREGDSDPSALLEDNDNDLDAAVKAFYGTQFAHEGLLKYNDLTVAFVLPKSRAAEAPLALNGDRETGDRLLNAPLKPAAQVGPRRDNAGGLQVGDVIVAINGGIVEDRSRALFWLLDAAALNDPIKLTVERGLPNPYVSHPRLDLFVSSMSPHRQEVFACTVCHEGQGSATDFNWASHTPNTREDEKDWKDKYGWFDNHHWIYPMYPTRFAESACLKCHHQVTELEPSLAFPEAPASKVTHGYQLIQKYGCFGCHEINGYENGESIGPDMRTEPNYYAAAYEVKNNPGYEKLADHEQALVETLIEHPERHDVRHELIQVLAQDADAGQSRLTDDAHNRVAAILADIENPGVLRKPGPSLRYAASKMDPAFLFDWIRAPGHFREDSRMPKFFGLWSHLDEGIPRDDAALYEPLEIYAMGKYIQMRSQEYDFASPPEGVEPADAVLGKRAFEARCIACHSHSDFPGIDDYRDVDRIQQAPDLSGLSAKFDPARNPNGRKWLYSWIKNPSQYHARTLMPDMILDPEPIKDSMGKITGYTDPIDNIVEYLMKDASNWKPGAGTITELNEGQLAVLDDLAGMHLKDAFFATSAERYLRSGIPESKRADLKGAEQELLVADEAFQAQQSLTLERKLLYVGRKSIAKYGCYGCHDIPGFEDAKPIGATMADWGLKEPSKLAFEHVHKFLHHGSHGHSGESHAEHAEGEDHEYAFEEPFGPNEVPPYFMDQLNTGNRIGFLYQKLASPRSYDYHKTVNKKFNERLRMPQFPFDDGDREAVMTFVLGLIAKPPSASYIYKPDPRTEAILAGKRVLEKYNCGGCHVLEADRLELAFGADTYGAQAGKPTFPYVAKQFLPADRQSSAEPDRRNQLHAVIEGMPTINVNPETRELAPIVNDDAGDPLFPEDSYDPNSIEYLFDLWKPALVAGNAYQPGELPLPVMATDISKRRPAIGGELTKYLLPHAYQWERESNPNAKAAEAWSWLPPPLVGQGSKVQTDWLHDFLLDPHMIRPAVLLQMPKFNMSPEEATALVNYFAAIDNASYPYTYDDRQQSGHLEGKERSYLDALRAAGAEGPFEPGRRFADAMQIITSPNYCVKCHIVGDFEPTGSDRAKGPDLSQMYRRMRPDYLRKWIAKPTSILPYTAMPVNIIYESDKPHLGTTVPQNLYHGNSLEQVDGLVDLLMNYDKYTRQRSRITPLVDESKKNDPTAADAAGGDAAANE
jgi:mono/diheme cytochrome c family protein